ncbi:uncharacterized protein LOC116110277 [Pistacia vera]|uniref:uncharacterized protein LOC116110277 n=1 Tax=Pistacia vera TaxID=55513 RepID=UPI0012637FF0|nr:uncharacterized protein LOC116110277 [Pistacia vera]
MPGTILVSVVEFKGLQSSSTAPPRISVNVSLGKKEYQTWGKEDFSFPLTTLRDNLMVKLHDAEGNEISRTDVETRLVVEKGLWDQTFPLDGGGHLHLKLQFVLSEEERHRIRSMRESALRKKHRELPSGNLRSPENATTVGINAESSLFLNQEVSDSETSLLQSEVATAQAGLVLTPADITRNERFGTEKGEGIFSLQKQAIPVKIDARRLHQSPLSQGFDDRLTEVSHKVENIETQTPVDDVPERTICSEEASYLSESSELVVAVKNKLIAPKLYEENTYNPQKQSPLGKAPSNVRNMISAFESSLAQDMRPHEKSPPLKSQSSRIETEAQKTSILDEVKTDKVKPTQPISVGRLKNPFLAGALQEASTYTRKGGDEHGPFRAFSEAKTYQDIRLLELSEADVKNKRKTGNMKNKLTDKEAELKERKNSSGDLMRASTGKAATVSGRLLDEHTGGQQSGKLFMNNQHSAGKSSMKESGKGVYPEYLEKEDWKDKHYSSICPGTWIFPVESRSLCITTGSKHLMDLMGNCHTKAKIHEEEKSSQPENAEEIATCYYKDPYKT